MGFIDMTDKDLKDAVISEGAGIVLRRLAMGYAQHPDRRFFVSDKESVSYREVFEDSLLLVSYLRNELGIQRGMLIYVSMPNTVQYAIFLIATETLGLRLALRAPGLIQDQLDADFAILYPDLIVVSSDDDYATVKKTVSNVRIMGVGDTVHTGKRIDAESRAYSCSKPPACQMEVGREGEIILFSSGSTGEPKAIASAISSFLFNAERLTAAFGLSFEDTLFLPVPFFHVYGIVGTFAALVSGASVATLVKYEPARAIDFVSRAGATVYFGVPTMFLRELAQPRVENEGKWKLRAGMIAGAGCPATAIGEYEARFGCALVQSYGMTETSATLTVGNLKDSLVDRAADVGYPIDGISMIADKETKEIIVKTPALMKGIYSSRGFEAPRLDSGGWLHTGDIGEITKNGTVRVVGRMDNVIIRGGINVAPEAIERVYRSHEDIADCYVVGYFDYELGQRTCLCVLPKQGLVQLQGIRDFALGRLDKCQYPDRVVLVDSFPRLRNGKIDRRTLARQIADGIDSN